MQRSVEYPGRLRIFREFGNCGMHPQFAHLEQAPSGYQFHFSERGPEPTPAERHGGIRQKLGRLRVGYRKGLVLLSSVCSLCHGAWRRGASAKAIWKFLRTRGLKSQLMIEGRDEFVFLPSVPFTLNQFPWLIEIEDTTSFFFPFIHNGKTTDFDIHGADFFPIFKHLVESENCRGIITHMQATAESIPKLFDNPALESKTHFVPLGIAAPPWDQVDRPDAGQHPIELLFTNSWHQAPGNFYLRGGLDVLEAYARIRESHPEARLTLRSQLPQDLDRRYLDIIERCGVRVLDRFLPAAEWEALRRDADFYLLPSARIHVVSILEAMAYGMALICSDGWGIQEYARDEHNAIVVKGRDDVAWIDPVTGLLKEDYASMRRSNPGIVDQIQQRVCDLIDDPSKRRALVLNARRDVDELFTIERWNRGLGRAFDAACKTPTGFSASETGGSAP